VSYPIETIEGIGPLHAGQLAPVGVKTTQDLLAHCASPAGRKKTAEATGLSEALLLKWTNMADLMRVKGVGEEYSELLEVAGVDSVRELKHRVAAHLHAKMVEVNEAKKLVRQLPSLSSVSEWIEQAKTIPAVVTH
jgi:predicted flap endonuclease-1-like 5' DNA nuclease